ncbi:hypothetical protein SGLAM104S_04877 [Streptomyces glaucescens]
MKGARGHAGRPVRSTAVGAPHGAVRHRRASRSARPPTTRPARPARHRRTGLPRPPPRRRRCAGPAGGRSVPPRVAAAGARRPPRTPTAGPRPTARRPGRAIELGRRPSIPENRPTACCLPQIVPHRLDGVPGAGQLPPGHVAFIPSWDPPSYELLLDQACNASPTIRTPSSVSTDSAWNCISRTRARAARAPPRCRSPGTPRPCRRRAPPPRRRGCARRRCPAADAFAPPEQVDLPLHALVRVLLAQQPEAEPGAEHLMAQTHREERPPLREQGVHRRAQVGDLRVARLARVAGTGPSTTRSYGAKLYGVSNRLPAPARPSPEARARASR